MRIIETLLVVALIGCGDGPGVEDAATPLDAGPADAGPGAHDAGRPDASEALDAGEAPDAGAPPDAALDAGAGVLVGEVVATEEGDVRGEVAGDLVIFRGVPFAEPPTGARRFAPPVSHAGWSDTLDATTFGPSCAQPTRMSWEGSEDCLHLNVWAHASGPARPVMVFIHGGAFTTGSSSLSLYEGSDLARAGGVVIVTINYRLGVLGFLTTEALAAANGSAGNFGILDQIAALEWVERNIAAFGGDPDDVTIFGESAGAMSVCALIGSPLADGLFDRGVIESGGGCHGFEEPRATFDRPSMMDRGLAFAATVGCDVTDQVGCLRDEATLTTERILTNQPSGRDELDRTLQEMLVYAPNIDGVVLAEDPIERLRRGATDVPIVVGSNADEARAFTATTFVPTWAGFENRVRAILGDADGDLVIPLYPRADSTPRQAYDTFLTDLAMSCPTISLAEASAAGEPTYVYHFERVMNGVFGALGATHVTELFFVFGNWPGSYTPAPEDLVVEADMQGAWTSFAHGGALALTPSWPRYDPAAPAFAIFDAPATLAAQIRGGRCAELRRLGIVP